MPEIQKLAKEPLVWLAAVVLGIPLFAPSLLTGLRDAVFVDSPFPSSGAASNPVSHMEIQLGKSSDSVSYSEEELPARTDPRAISDLPPMPDFSSPGQSLESTVSPADETSASDYLQVAQKSENDRQELEPDFLFGDEDDIEAKTKDDKAVGGESPKLENPTWLFPETAITSKSDEELPSRHPEP